MSEISKVSNQNSNLRLLLARTTNKLQVFIIKNVIYYKLHLNDPVYRKIHS